MPNGVNFCIKKEVKYKKVVLVVLGNNKYPIYKNILFLN